MKAAILLTAALLTAATATALPRHILITFDETVYAENPKPEKAQKECEKYIDAPSILGHSIGGWTNATGDVYGWTLHWHEHWTEKAAKLDDEAKLATLNTKLEFAGVTLIPCDDWRQAIDDAGLYQIVTVNTGSSTTTTTITATTTTTTTAGTP